jgi:hypothetical protein
MQSRAWRSRSASAEMSRALPRMRRGEVGRLQRGRRRIGPDAHRADPVRPGDKLLSAAASPRPGSAMTCSCGTKTSANSTSEVSFSRLPILRSGSSTAMPLAPRSTSRIAWAPSTTHSTVMMSAAQELVIQRLRPLSRKPPGTGTAVVPSRRPTGRCSHRVRGWRTSQRSRRGPALAETRRGQEVGQHQSCGRQQCLPVVECRRDSRCEISQFLECQRVLAVEPRPFDASPAQGALERTYRAPRLS